MTKDTQLRLTASIYFVNKLLEELQTTAAQEQDGRFNNWIIQAYGLKQDIEDKMREDLIEGPIQIASAPNITPSTPPQTGAVPPANGTPAPNTGAVPPTGASNPATGGNATSGNAVSDFFNNVLGGAANNNDLNDILNQLNGGTGTNNNGSNTGNNAPF